jgi:hypothetical protein
MSGVINVKRRYVSVTEPQETGHICVFTLSVAITMNVCIEVTCNARLGVSFTVLAGVSGIKTAGLTEPLSLMSHPLTLRHINAYIPRGSSDPGTLRTLSQISQIVSAEPTAVSLG